ncbi:uncharacterized protein K452DRAFT_233582 [Aplosporella prunicola CBS 121167]|uniref:NmrA-like domain-containing protein n=1 Tax=Aplosporella prunicola CBS 121167 TaxID=1176127 RepID=A0A6A6B3V0_9PEZI|nr:uncharacterized protein K452DRAFT_233582 [Aplosporella prunicola CBS 121167]KAF2138892.1 hypothetical protein K452DRAFT_233582 [Aplosporella prunicola CBS 121167]
MSTDNARKAVLITGATGKQGGAVIDALLANHPKLFTILAVTRNPTSASAARLAAKSAAITLVQGDLDDVPALFSAAAAASIEPIWGVYSVQVSHGKGVTSEGEIAQGKALIDEALKAGVSYFVYSSVERGGEERSWDNETPIPHFQTKLHIERHLVEATKGSAMSWTILRPVAFMDNLAPGFPSKVFLTALRDTLGPNKSMQWVATADIGYFAAEALARPEEYKGKAVGLAGDELTFGQLSDAFERATGYAAGTTFSFLGSTLMYMVAEMGTMVRWFGDEGYSADIGACREKHPKMMDFETWLREKSGWAAK